MMSLDHVCMCVLWSDPQCDASLTAPLFSIIADQTALLIRFNDLRIPVGLAPLLLNTFNKRGRFPVWDACRLRPSRGGAQQVLPRIKLQLLLGESSPDFCFCLDLC